MADLLLALAPAALLVTYIVGHLIGRWCERGRIADWLPASSAALAYKIRVGVHRGRKP